MTGPICLKATPKRPWLIFSVMVRVPYSGILCSWVSMGTMLQVLTVRILIVRFPYSKVPYNKGSLQYESVIVMVLYS
jgi:hypothetical protein